MKQRVILFIILMILISLALWLLRGWTALFVQAWLPPLAGAMGTQIQAVAALISLVVLLGGGVWRLWTWLSERPPTQIDEQLPPLKPTTWQQIRNRQPQGASIAWVDRGATDPNQLPAQPRIALVGKGG